MATAAICFLIPTLQHHSGVSPVGKLLGTGRNDGIMLLAEEDQRLELYVYVGTPSKEGVAYLFAKENAGSFFIQLQEFHFFSLRKDPVHNYDHGLLLSYNPEWGWKNISFGIILKENQDMVQRLFDSVKNPMKPVELPDSNRMNAETVKHAYPWQ